MKLPDDAIKRLPSFAETPDEQQISDMDGTEFDLVVGDLIDNRTKAELDNPTDRGRKRFSLLDYALNLSPALRDTITRDVAQNVSAFELRLPRPRPLLSRSRDDTREGSVQSKASYLLKPPKAAK